MKKMLKNKKLLNKNAKKIFEVPRKEIREIFPRIYNNKTEANLIENNVKLKEKNSLKDYSNHSKTLAKENGELITFHITQKNIIWNNNSIIKSGKSGLNNNIITPRVSQSASTFYSTINSYRLKNKQQSILNTSKSNNNLEQQLKTHNTNDITKNSTISINQHIYKPISLSPKKPINKIIRNKLDFNTRLEKSLPIDLEVVNSLHSLKAVSFRASQPNKYLTASANNSINNKTEQSNDYVHNSGNQPMNLKNGLLLNNRININHSHSPGKIKCNFKKVKLTWDKEKVDYVNKNKDLSLTKLSKTFRKESR